MGPPQGPFTPTQLQQLLRAGVLQQDTQVQHPKHGAMTLSEVLLLPEPPSARLLREREQQQQRQQQLPEAHHRPRQQQPNGEGQNWSKRPRWGGGRPGGWRARQEDERRRQQWEWEEQQRQEAAVAAEAEVRLCWRA